jgi:hypothetical protein
MVEENGTSETPSNSGRRAVTVVCPNLTCGMVLNNPMVVMGSPPVPAIKLGWRYFSPDVGDKNPHILHVSSVWGDHTLISDTPIRDGEVLDLFCPFCGQSFPTKAHCDCNARMVMLLTQQGESQWSDSVLICARRGCPGHRTVRLEDYRAAAGLQVMCGGMRIMDTPVMRAGGIMTPRGARK